MKRCKGEESLGSCQAQGQCRLIRRGGSSVSFHISFDQKRRERVLKTGPYRPQVVQQAQEQEQEYQHYVTDHGDEIRPGGTMGQIAHSAEEDRFWCRVPIMFSRFS
jgi:hypothetical protein